MELVETEKYFLLFTYQGTQECVNRSHLLWRRFYECEIAKRAVWNCRLNRLAKTLLKLMYLLVFLGSIRREKFHYFCNKANFGGLMGLCLGFSGLSLIEVIYFLTLHAYCRARRHRRDRQVQEKSNWKLGIPRSETTTELLNNEISSIPVYKSPDIGFRKIVEYKKKKQGLNVPYNVDFSHNVN